YVSRCVLQHKPQSQHPFQKAFGEDFVVWVQDTAMHRKLNRQGQIPSEVNQQPLRSLIRESYNRADFEVLCYDLGLSIDDLADHRPLEAQIMELIDRCRRHNRYEQLLKQV